MTRLGESGKLSSGGFRQMLPKGEFMARGRGQHGPWADPEDSRKSLGAQCHVDTSTQLVFVHIKANNLFSPLVGRRGRRGKWWG